MERKIQNLNWREFAEAIKSSRGAILPVGTIEAHGCTNLGTDVTIPEYLAERLAERLDLLIAPTINYGITRTLLPYPGSLTISPEVFEAYVYDAAESLIRAGFEWILMINGHGGNNRQLENIAQELWKNTGGKSVVIHWWQFCDPLTERVMGEIGGHAGLDETYMVMAANPELVKEKLFNEADAYLVRDGAYPYPNAGPLLLYEEGKGLPRFDRKEAVEYADAVTEYLAEYLKEVVGNWDRFLNT